MSESEAALHIPPEFGDYADSYRTAGSQLAGLAVGKPDLGHRLALPTLFLFRHALELALKDANVWTEATIAVAPDIAPHKSVEEVRRELNGHKLQPLLDRLVERFGLIDNHNLNPDSDHIRRLVGPAVMALDGLDTDGQRLRYPYLAQGRGPSWPDGRSGPSGSDLLDLSLDVETALHHLLDVMGSWFSAAADRAIEDAWISQLWEAEVRALQLEAAWGPWELGATGKFAADAWPSGIVDELKSDMSAELLDDGDDP